jgi:hypothetical protein
MFSKASEPWRQLPTVVGKRYTEMDYFIGFLKTGGYYYGINTKRNSIAKEPLGNEPSKRVQACDLLGMNNFWGI